MFKVKVSRPTALTLGLLFGFALTAPAVAQGPIPRAPVPQDQYELVTGSVQYLATPEDRLSALTLLRSAAAKAISHAPRMNPFNFTATFNATGTIAGTGQGEITELWTSGQNWRVTEKLGDYSLVRVGYSGQIADEKIVSTIPMRAQMLRNEILWAAASIVNGPGVAGIRRAPAQWNGKAVTCLLLSNVTAAGFVERQSRLWEENEYCIANDTGLLQVHSFAPGTYTVFSYSKNQQFHGHIIPDHIETFVSGARVIEADLKITDAGAAGDALTPTATMRSNGRSPVTLNEPSRRLLFIPAPGSVLQSVMVHAEVDSEGKVQDAEISTTTDPGLSQAALDLVKQTNFGGQGSTQTYVTVRLGPRQQ